MPLFDSITDLTCAANTLRQRRYGVIEVVNGRFQRVLLRPLAQDSDWPGGALAGPEWLHRWRRGDWLLLYYNQPWRFPQLLGTGTMAGFPAGKTDRRSVRVGLEALDEIARRKNSDALLCDVLRQLANFGTIHAALGLGAPLSDVRGIATLSNVSRDLSTAAGLDR